MGQAKRVFVSYARRNEAVARSLIDELRRQGFVVLGDPQDLKAGDNWQGKTEEDIRSADAVVVLVAGNKPPTKYQELEWSCTLESYWADQRKLLLPVLIGDAPLPSFVARFQALRLPDASSGWADVIQTLQELGAGSKQTLLKDTSQLRERLKNLEDLAQSLKKDPSSW
jgi:hypothetical protein